MLMEFILGLTGNSLVDPLMVAIAEYTVYLVPLLLAYLFYRDRFESFLVGASGVAGLAVSYAVGLLYSHPGPYTVFNTLLTDPVGENAFPSQHTTLVFSIAFATAYKRPRLGAAALFIAVLTGFARVYTGLHWPIDVLGGVFAAGIGAGLVMYFREPLQKSIKELVEHF